MAQVFGVKLKKVDTQHQRSIPIRLICDGENYQHLMSETYLEQYFSSIESVSFQTRFHPLTRSSALSLFQAHSSPATLSTDATQELLLLEQAIDKAKSELGCEFIFVRLSSRSPKDFPLLGTTEQKQELVRLFERELHWIIEDEQSLSQEEIGTLENSKLHAFHRAMTFAMAMKNGHLAIESLIRSDRIQDDLHQFGVGNIPEPFGIAIREFTNFDPDLEFRAFIYQRKLTALTQYNEYVYYPWLKKCVSQIEAIIKEFLSEHILNTIPIPNAVVDIVLIRTNQLAFDKKLHGTNRFNTNKLLEVRVIEINPLAEFAGTGLFTWENDRNILLGQSPYQFRILHSVPSFSSTINSLSPDVKKFILSNH